MKKPIIAAISLCFAYSQCASATTYEHTKITNTDIQKNGTNAPTEKGKYSRPPIDDKQLEALVRKEVIALNAIMRSTTTTMAKNAKNGKFDLAVLSSDLEQSVPLSEVIEPDVEWEAESRKREIENLARIERYKRGEVTAEEIMRQQLESIFPVQTHLKATKLPSREIKVPSNLISKVVEPLAVIGADVYSLSWFKLNVEAIRKLRAGVVVTQVDSLADFEVIRSLAPDIQFQPVDATLFLENLGVHVYPVLVTNQGVYQ